MNVLVTGAGGGFGRLISKTLIDGGHNVFGTMRNIEGRNKEHADNLRAIGGKVYEMDVTNWENVEKAVASIISDAGEIDVVVNNAGLGVIGMQEFFTPEDRQRVFDINVFGVQRVIRAVLPHLRKRGNGLLLQISSCLGRFTLPFYGPYNASKYTLEAMSDNYRLELSGFGVDVAVVQPGGFPTEFGANLMQASDNSRADSYGEFMNGPMQLGEAFGAALQANTQQDPQLVADAVKQVIETPAGQREFRTVVDKMGMEEPITVANQAAEGAAKGILGAFQMDGMMNVRVS